MDKDLIKKGYNQVAEDYASQRNPSGDREYLEKFNELLNPRSTILDLGCGAGIPVDEFFVSNGHKIIGLDISDKMIELAKKNVLEAEYKVEDMASLKTNEYSVDAVVSFYAIFHTDRKKHLEIFKKINSFLPKGGLILATMGGGEYEGLEDNFYGTRMQWSHYGREKNKEIIEQAGFEILSDEITKGAEKHLVVVAKKV